MLLRLIVGSDDCDVVVYWKSLIITITDYFNKYCSDYNCNY